MSDCALLRVSQKFLFVDEKIEAEVTNVETLDVVLFRQGREVPSLSPVFAKLNGLHVFDFAIFLEIFNLLFIVT